ncbi:MAG: hypothetical protein B6247_24450 [Candidatus Parabeggiatoa sp. nov. 2]|nr:MAG: hypothetical protein B6247_24450 [Beggiatoa sp. 4572_84]
MSKNLGKEFSMEGESRKMTVLFSDVRGFTTLSENLEPKELSELMTEYLTPMTHGIGLNTGIMSVGNMGSQFRMAYTVLGDAVNLGSRLEGTTKAYGVQIIVSESTKNAVPEYLYRELDRVRVKGKDKPVVIYEPIGLREEADDRLVAEIAEYEQALEHYRQQRWEAAKEQFAKHCGKYPNCMLYRIYMERIEHFMENPPGENWDGVYVFTTK